MCIVRRSGVSFILFAVIENIQLDADSCDDERRHESRFQCKNKKMYTQNLLALLHHNFIHLKFMYASIHTFLVGRCTIVLYTMVVVVVWRETDILNTFFCLFLRLPILVYKHVFICMDFFDVCVCICVGGWNSKN